ncbi:cell division protein ZipA [Psychromonas antarctica]|uniref:cell division protein ZipA n=1 Tax=Psychromonas antarctica TaxID=67573 RepID=UPI001EE93AC0|nr:cell division protein ZipA [Psychromonas antarctica]MCG6201725.1 cell division protein ZipA [Psychromonas antarctica]
MQHFQPILIIIGMLAIAAVLIHGYLLNRKAKPSVTEPLSVADTENNEFDCDDGIIGDVRIVHSGQDDDDSDFLTVLDTKEYADGINLSEEPQISPENITPQESSEDFLQPLSSSDDEQTKEEIAAAHLRDEVEKEFLLKADDDEQINTQETQDIFIFNVVAREEEALVRGHELLQFFLTAGFRFGQMSIFHRHLHSDGTGPILFSIANMMAPGTFDPENMEQFRSQGVSFFLTAPNNQINIKAAFDMMLVAVEQMAEEFDCIVLNAEREPLTEKEFRHYHERLLHYI